jgi:hypothetical protein
VGEASVGKQRPPVCLVSPAARRLLHCPPSNIMCGVRLLADRRVAGRQPADTTSTTTINSSPSVAVAMNLLPLRRRWWRGTARGRTTAVCACDTYPPVLSPPKRKVGRAYQGAVRPSSRALPARGRSSVGGRRNFTATAHAELAATDRARMQGCAVIRRGRSGRSPLQNPLACCRNNKTRPPIDRRIGGGRFPSLRRSCCSRVPAPPVPIVRELHSRLLRRIRTADKGSRG